VENRVPHTPSGGNHSSYPERAFPRDFRAYVPMSRGVSTGSR